MSLLYSKVTFSKYLGSTGTYVIRGLDMIISIYWFLQYHPEDTNHDCRKLEDDSSKLIALDITPNINTKIKKRRFYRG